MSQMDRFRPPEDLGLLVIPLFLLIAKVEAQGPNDQAGSAPQGAMSANFQPSLSIVIGILSLMFTITFMLLVYAKFCHRSRGDPENPPALFAGTVSPRFSGIDKTVIESLPFFRFSSLKGMRQGLECAVCLSKFEDVEILRMLPKCKHAFHIDCIDNWLEKHSSCPLCRRKVSTEDPSLFTYTSSMRAADSGDGDRPSFEVFIEREEEESRFGGFGSSFHRIFRGNGNGGNVRRNAGDNLENGEIREEEEFEFHRFNHRIVVSDVMTKHRWSSLTPSDVMFLSKQMSTNSTTGVQFQNPQSKPKQGEISEERDVGGNETKAASSADRRVVSEITAVTRFADPGQENRVGTLDERTKRLWLPIASRTVHWFANRESRPGDGGHHVAS